MGQSSRELSRSPSSSPPSSVSRRSRPPRRTSECEPPSNGGWFFSRRSPPRESTPYGYEPLLLSLNIVGAKEIDVLEEWKPIGFDLPGAYGAAFIAGSLAILAFARAGWTRARRPWFAPP